MSLLIFFRAEFVPKQITAPRTGFYNNAQQSARVSLNSNMPKRLANKQSSKR